MNLSHSTFVPGGVASHGQLPLDSPYLFAIALASAILLLLLTLLIRELCVGQRCQCRCEGPRYASFDDFGASCAEACDCCQRTSFDSCLDACCPKRGSLDAADLLTCAICCSSSTRSPADTTTGASCFDCLLRLGGNDSLPRTS